MTQKRQKIYEEGGREGGSERVNILTVPLSNSILNKSILANAPSLTDFLSSFPPTTLDCIEKKRREREKEKESKTATYVTIVCNTPSLSWKTIKRKPHPQVPSSLPHTHTKSRMLKNISNSYPSNIIESYPITKSACTSFMGHFFSFKGFNH